MHFTLVVTLFSTFSDKSSGQAKQHQNDGKGAMTASGPQRRSKSSKTYNTDHHVNGSINGYIMNLQHADKQQVIVAQVIPDIGIRII